MRNLSQVGDNRNLGMKGPVVGGETNFGGMQNDNRNIFNPNEFK